MLHFLRLHGLIALLTTLFAIFLVGCGGRGGDGAQGDYRLNRVTAQVSLPAGTASPSMSSLNVWTSVGQGTPSANGHVSVSVLGTAGPQYTDVRDASGRLVLAGFVGVDRTQINVESTAELLAYFFTGGPYVPAENEVEFLNGMTSLSGFQAVADAVEDQISTQGYLDLEGTNLGAALQALATGLSNRGRGTIVEPTSDSGLAINNSIDGQISVSNVYLRRIVGFLQRTGYRNADNQFVSSPGPVTNISIDPPKRFNGVVGTVGDVLTGNLPYSAVTAGPFPTPFEGPSGTEATVYELRVGGLGAEQGNHNFQGEEFQAVQRNVVKTMLLDGAFPFIVKVILPIGGSTLDDLLAYSNGSAILSEMVNTLLLTAPAVYEQAAAGNNKQALITAYEATVGSGTMQTLLIQLMIQFGESISVNFFENSGQFAEDVSARLAVLGFVDMVGSSADLILFLRDVAVSNQNYKFQIMVTGGKATIASDKFLPIIDDVVNLNVVIQDKDPEAVYRYEWSVSEGFTLSNANGTTNSAPNGILIGSSELAVLVNDTGEPGTATVTCKVVRVDGAIDKPVDKPQLDVQFVRGPTVTPNPAVVSFNDDVTLTAEFDTDVPVYWKFSLNTTEFGTINRTNIGDNPIVTFSANNKQGTAVLTAECFANANGTALIATVAVPILVGDIEGIPVTISYSTNIQLDPPIAPAPGGDYVGTAWASIVGVPDPAPSGVVWWSLRANGVEIDTWRPESPPFTGTPVLARFNGVGVPIDVGEISAPSWVSTNGKSGLEIVQETLPILLQQLKDRYDGKVLTLVAEYVDK